MDQTVNTSKSFFSLSSATIIIGVIQAIIYTVIFFGEYAEVFVDIWESPSPKYTLRYLLEDLYIGETTEGAILICVVCSVMLIIGVKKSKPGFLLAWIINTIVAVMSSMLMLLYHFILISSQVPLKELFLQFLITGFHFFCFVVVFTHFMELQLRNLR